MPPGIEVYLVAQVSRPVECSSTAIHTLRSPATTSPRPETGGRTRPALQSAMVSSGTSIRLRLLQLRKVGCPCLTAVNLARRRPYHLPGTGRSCWKFTPPRTRSRVPLGCPLLQPHCLAFGRMTRFTQVRPCRDVFASSIRPPPNPPAMRTWVAGKGSASMLT